jgi:hypothetical protein
MTVWYGLLTRRGRPPLSIGVQWPPVLPAIKRSKVRTTRGDRMALSGGAPPTEGVSYEPQRPPDGADAVADHFQAVLGVVRGEF